MAVDDVYVEVQRSQLDFLRQHCERCPYFGEQLRGLSDGRPSGKPSKKRKTLHELRPQEVSQPSHSSQQPEPQLPSQPSQELEPQLPLQPSQQPEPQLPLQPSQQPEPQLPLQPSQEPGSQLPSGSLNTSKPKRAPAKGPPQKPLKNAAADWFLRHAPMATEWRKKQTELELNTVEQYEQAIQAFTARTNIIVGREPYRGDGRSEHELVDLAERFALLTRDSLTNAKLQRSFATFQALILLSYCQVLRKRGVSYETVDRIMQHVAGREYDRRRLLESALWINGLIVALVSNGWTIYRATELFFLDALSITRLTQIRNDESSRSILEHLKTDEFVKHDYSDCLRPEYTIPGLVASLLDSCNRTANRISIDEICSALGYNSDRVPKSVESIYKVHVATKSAPVVPANPDFEVLVPSSFQSIDGPPTLVSNPYHTNRASDRSLLYTEGNGQQSMILARDTSALSMGHLPHSTRSDPMTTPLNSSNAITSASVQNVVQLTSLAPEAQVSYASCPTQATPSVVYRFIGARSTRANLRRIPVDMFSIADTPQCESLVESAGDVVSQPSRNVSHPGPQRQFPTQMKVSDTAQSILFAMKGDIDGLKYLFSQGFASPRDVSDSRGFSLISWALYGGMCNYKTVQFLLSQGAFVDEDSYHHAWDFAFRMKCSSTELNELRCITLNPPSTERDWIEEQQFPQVHSIILGRSIKLLKAELDDNPDAVRATDAKGRTALDWATARAQLSDMRLLIARGSPLNTMDVSGRTTVLHAVDSHNDDALRIVLEAGANPNPEVPKGLFRSSPLTAASFGGLVGMIKLLIESGAKIDEHNPEGRTALQAVASMQNVECADILLTCGADLDYISKNGQSPFTTAIMCNNHAVLKLFLDRCHASRLKWPQLLPIIAESADAETISILASSNLPLKRTLLDRDGFAVGRETLRSRMDYDERLGDAFKELFSLARADKEAATFRTPDARRQTAASNSG